MKHEDVPHKGAFEHPNTVSDGELVGVDGDETPVYYDPNDRVAFEGVEREDGYGVGEQRAEGPLESVVATIGDAVGWNALADDEGKDG